MTKAQAIDVLKDMVLDYGYASHKAEVEEAVGMACDALEQLNSNEFNSNPTQFNSINLISRQAVMWMLTNLSYTQCKTQGEADVIGLAKTLLIAMPSAQASYRQVTGKLDITDCISRQAAIDALMKRDKELCNINWYDKPFAEDECRGIDYALEIVNALPSAQPEPSQVARDIATILENEQDMRVIARNEIIRCKDCKHWRQQTNYEGVQLSFGFCESDDMWRSLYGETYEVSHIDTDDDFYCGYAERRTDEPDKQTD